MSDFSDVVARSLPTQNPKGLLLLQPSVDEIEDFERMTPDSIASKSV